jgi:hypothetical protein
MTCANTALRQRPRNDDLRIEMNRLLVPHHVAQNVRHMGGLKDGSVGE